jgi:hypothetical protein
MNRLGNSGFTNSIKIEMLNFQNESFWKLGLQTESSLLLPTVSHCSNTDDLYFNPARFGAF